MHNFILLVDFHQFCEFLFICYRAVNAGAKHFAFWWKKKDAPLQEQTRETEKKRETDREKERARERAKKIRNFIRSWKMVMFF